MTTQTQRKKAKKLSVREYWILTEVFTHLHNGDTCNHNKTVSMTKETLDIIKSEMFYSNGKQKEPDVERILSALIKDKSVKITGMISINADHTGRVECNIECSED